MGWVELRRATARAGSLLKFPASLPDLVMPPASLLRPLALTGVGLIAGQWLISDVMHLPGGGMGLLAAGGVVIWLGSKPSQPRFAAPVSQEGWMARCQEVLDQFARFEQQPAADQARRADLKSVVERAETPVRVAMVALGVLRQPTKPTSAVPWRLCAADAVAVPPLY